MAPRTFLGAGCRCAAVAENALSGPRFMPCNAFKRGFCKTAALQTPLGRQGIPTRQMNVAVRRIARIVKDTNYQWTKAKIHQVSRRFEGRPRVLVVPPSQAGRLLGGDAGETGRFRLIPVSRKALSKLSKESRPCAGRWQCCTIARRWDETSMNTSVSPQPAVIPTRKQPAIRPRSQSENQLRRGGEL